jgi:hypothetical protein
VNVAADVAPLDRWDSRLGRWNWTLLVRGSSLAAIVVALAVGAALGEPRAIVVAALGLVVGLALVRRSFRADERRFLLGLFLAAFGLRVVAAVVSHFVLVSLGRGGFLLLDDRAYDKLGWTLAGLWMGIFPGVRESDEYLLVNYTYLVAIVYYLMGYSLLTAKMLNVAFGALLAVVVYAIGAEILSRRAARVAAVITAFFPSLVAWSVLNLKDILVVLLTAATVLGLLRYARRHEWWALVLALTAFLGLENLRQFAFFIVGWLMPIAFLFADRSRLSRKVALLVPLVVGVIAINVATHNASYGLNWLTPRGLSAAEWTRFLAETNAQTGIEAEPVKPVKDNSTVVQRSIAYLPKGVFYALFGPLPWDARSGLAMAVIPEMLAWYGLLTAALLGLRLSFRRHWRDLVLPMGFAAGWAVALALTEGNTGNIFRHRSMFMPFVFPVAAVGLLWLWDRWQASRVRRPVAPAHADAADGLRVPRSMTSGC